MENEIENISILLSTIEIEESTTPLLPLLLIHYIFDTYVGTGYKLLIHKEGSSDEDRSKVLSIELIMISRMEDYFKDVLLCNKFKSKLCNDACNRGYVNTLKWARQNGCPWNSSTCSSAAGSGHLSCLQWAQENGCPWNSDTCKDAAKNGHLNILQWARDNGCPWNNDTCSSAAAGGHLNILQWARENGCEWGSDTCRDAASNGHLSILQWARENGCEWERKDCLLCARGKNHAEVVRWIESTAF